MNAHLRVAALALFIALGVVLGLGACKTKEKVNQAGEAVSKYAKEVGESAEKLGTRAGEKIGLLEKKWDYVRLAYGSAEAPAKLRATYTLGEEREAGRALGAEFIGRYGVCENARLDRYLNLVLASLAAHSERPGLPCHVAVLQSEEYRSFAAPGGYVFVTLGSLRAAESESEVAGMLAQALAHSQLRHSLALLERVLYGREAEAGIKPVTQAGAQEFSVAVEETARLLMRNGFSLEEIGAASREATTMLVRLGYEPGGLRAFLARAKVRMLEKAGGRPPADLALFRAGEQAVDARLAGLHAPETGRSVSDRYRRECLALLPIPRAKP